MIVLLLLFCCILFFLWFPHVIHILIYLSYLFIHIILIFVYLVLSSPKLRVSCLSLLRVIVCVGVCVTSRRVRCAVLVFRTLFWFVRCWGSASVVQQDLHKPWQWNHSTTTLVLQQTHRNTTATPQGHYSDITATPARERNSNTTTTQTPPHQYYCNSQRYFIATSQTSVLLITPSYNTSKQHFKSTLLNTTLRVTFFTPHLTHESPYNPGVSQNFTTPTSFNTSTHLATWQHLKNLQNKRLTATQHHISTSPL